ncbi:hypothetical protein LTR47_003616 [Exophiala xenobiotica]|nr:hypothetical protein LTR92_008104 [Exophiala xenobiotica]KAK5235431.1 hypothetical protein LTR47_003616 [Exophiala xenobiotica]KAK5245227.1 hypothetical protein LTS06_009322 [Exophiala xenobiotica]KAK5321412.1 hypothetical protein LTR93_006655 [Exophiala xenobiotica]KAK5347801.1 hypothetical protein LTR61_008430 [Exophiala xenobiotica]
MAPPLGEEPLEASLTSLKDTIQEGRKLIASSRDKFKEFDSVLQQDYLDQLDKTSAKILSTMAINLAEPFASNANKLVNDLTIIITSLAETSEEKRQMALTKTELLEKASLGELEVEKQKKEAQTSADNLERRFELLDTISKQLAEKEKEWLATRKSLEEQVEVLTTELDAAKATTASFQERLKAYEDQNQDAAWELKITNTKEEAERKTHEKDEQEFRQKLELVTKQHERHGADQERKASDLAKDLAQAQHDVGVEAGELKSLEDSYRSLRSKYYTLQDNLNQQVAQRSAFFECM